ncbi:MAG: AAA domain-containing protein [archaeon]|nr:AAA domain-containing protein [archaeon]
MESDEIKDVFTRSAEDLLRYSLHEGGISEAVTDVTSYESIGGGHFLLKLDSPLDETSGLVLYLGEDPIPSENGTNYGFPFFDRRTRTLALEVINPCISGIIESQHPVLSLVSDLTFLIQNVREYYSEFGDLVRIPEREPVRGDTPCRFPSDFQPSSEQRNAVNSILTSSMSYIWGAPGTGKTQMVLATSIMDYLSRGGKVAVIAPTNNSVEQVLRGLMKAVSADETFSALIDPRKDILRLGSATEDFVADHPELCESTGIDALVHRLTKELCLYRDLIRIKGYATVKERLEVLSGMYAVNAPSGETRPVEEEVLAVLSKERRFRRLKLGPERIGPLLEKLTRSERSKKALSESAGYTVGKLESLAEDLVQRIEYLEAVKGSADVSTARIIACTPQVYIGRFVPKGVDGGDRPSFDVDHIFVDEAGYCSAVLALVLYANHVPVTFLGDHKQLPPVFPVEEEYLKRVTGKDGFMQYAFLWDLSAIYCEDILRRSIADLEEMYSSSEDPVFERTSRVDLTCSHRFGRNLGELLDRYVYHNGISGSGDHPLEIVCIDVKCPPRTERVNRPEAMAVKEYVETVLGRDDEFCILTPYKHQIAVLKEVMPAYADTNIITVHRSQGREWDTVIMSVQDGEGIDRDVPLRFTSSRSDTGMKVMNTAVSRAKRRLVMVCDRSFWLSQEDEMVSGLVSDGVCGEVYSYSEETGLVCNDRTVRR